MTGPSGPIHPSGTQRRGRAAAREAARRRKRRQRRLLGAGLVVVTLLAGGGYLALADSIGRGGSEPSAADSDDNSSPPPLSSPDFLLDARAAKVLSSKGSWKVTATSEGQQAPDRSFTCQAQRFADPTGVRAWVRTLSNPAAEDSAVQWVELSSDPTNAGRAFTTISGWLSTCNTTQQRLVSSYLASGLGDRALLAIFGQPAGDDGDERYRAITLATSGPATMVLEHNFVASRPPVAVDVLAASAAALERICAEIESTCAKAPKATPSLLPASGEPRGFMAPIDLPVIGALKQPWVSVDGSKVGSGCEAIDLVKAKAKRSKVRTYVVPSAGIPQEFGLDTMVAEFAGSKQATAFVSGVQKSVKNCPTTHSNAKVKSGRSIDWDGIHGLTWRLQYALPNGASATYRIGIVRTGSRATYVMFPVTKGLDIGDDAFADVVIRAGERSRTFR